LYKVLLDVSGLSQKRAADFHSVRLDTVKSWCGGRNEAPVGVVSELADLIERMSNAIDQAVAKIDEMQTKHGNPQTIELGFCTDDYEAETLGWPSANVHSRVIGRIAASATAKGYDVKIVPRGSTPATSAAADANA
jgi:hypothetical protein